jgi:hypothetical protein
MSRERPRSLYAYTKLIILPYEITAVKELADVIVFPVGNFGNHHDEEL